MGLKKVAIISSHCDNQEKIDVLNYNLKLLKSLGVDTLVYSTVKIDVDSDYLFITKDNPVLTWPEKGILAWVTISYQGKTLKLLRCLQDFQWASLYQVKKMMEIIHTYDYDIFYLMIYDLLIDEELIRDINNNKINIVYPRKDFNRNKIYPSSPHFGIFDKQKIKQLSNVLDKKGYLNLNDGFAEDYYHSCVQLIGMESSQHTVKDTVCILNSIKTFDYSQSEQYKIFFSKDDEKFSLVCYEIKKPLTIKINQKTYGVNLSEIFLETDLICSNIFCIQVDCDGINVDYLPIYQNIIRNTLFLE